MFPSWYLVAAINPVSFEVALFGASLIVGATRIDLRIVWCTVGTQNYLLNERIGISLHWTDSIPSPLPLPHPKTVSGDDLLVF